MTFSKIVYSWLKDEWYKPDYNKFRGGIDEQLIIDPDLNDEGQNQRRLELLRATRSPLIDPIPDDTNWYEIEIEHNDLPRTFHIICSDWGDITNQKFQVVETIKNIYTNKNGAKKIREIMSSENGKAPITGLILVGSGLDSLFTVIEGNHRFSAVVANQIDHKSDSIIAKSSFLGISQKMKDYTWHIENHV